MNCIKIQSSFGKIIWIWAILMYMVQICQKF